MISQEHLKKLDNSELNEVLDKNLDVLELCVDGIISNHEDTLPLYWAIEDTYILIKEAQLRLNSAPE